MAKIKSVNINFGDDFHVADFIMSDGVTCKCLGVYTDETLALGKAITVTEATPRDDETEQLCESITVAILDAAMKKMME